MSQPRRAEPSRPPQRHRQRILRSAAKVFSRLGFRATTMDDIAKEVKATRGLVYYHFKSKAQIFYELHMATLDALTAAYHRSTDSARGPAQKMERAIQSHVSFTCRNLTLAGVTSRMMEVQHARDFPKRYREAIIAQRDAYERLVQGLLEEGVRQGVFRPTDTRLAVKTILGALNWMCFWYRPRGRLSAAEVTRLTSDTIMRGLLAERKEGRKERL